MNSNDSQHLFVLLQKHMMLSLFSFTLRRFCFRVRPPAKTNPGLCVRYRTSKASLLHLCNNNNNNNTSRLGNTQTTSEISHLKLDDRVQADYTEAVMIHSANPDHSDLAESQSCHRGSRLRPAMHPNPYFPIQQ